MKYKPLPKNHALWFKNIVNNITWVLTEYNVYSVKVKNSRLTGKMLVYSQIIFKLYIL